ncbi:Gfo/Idh/MocA family oxidoreductase [Micromonospora sp. WMMD980]|uniref:Gfo/Idh/MocA family oxidoreductase n=1 Tax=Micromonospora sp. WMMD980 TaxID=3016088 RepID=UPI002416DA2F|nr:Gfo/Idh/MocA family oxidoreductase [Micromonospora sp. WMMD980]MDG4799981.1 Gfo/Idh/MocA family oxidoreductase [Micromonospora sp. WMMD980]
MSTPAPRPRTEESRTPPLRVLVCGTNFGRFYLRAIADLAPGLELAGVLSRGGTASRELARRYGVAHHGSLDTVGDDIDLACVVVGSTVSGGPGTDLARALMSRGVHVLQEHPVHHDEMVAGLQLARRQGVQYRVNAHYHHVEPVRRFLAAAARLRERERPLFVDAATPVHVLYPFVDILGRALGGLRPWRVDEPGGDGPLRSLTGRLGGVPLTVRVHHQLDPADRDNHALLWHRIAIGTGAGVLTLADTHGPVLWSPRLHAGRDDERRLVFAGPGLDESSTAVLPGTGPGSGQEIFDRLWPEAVRRAVAGFAESVRAGGDPLRAAQYDITACRVWAELAARLGPPEIVRPARPALVTVADLADPPQPATVGPTRPWSPAPPVDPTGQQGPAPDRPRSAEPASAPSGSRDDGPEPYSPTAEFFDLAAAPHVTAGSAPAVVSALAGVDPGAGPVVEIGAGSGLITAAVARAYPALELLACEPAVGMRAVLTSRIYRDPDLRRRVTVSAQAAPDLDLPDTISGAVVCGVAGHLDAGDRQRLWRRLADRLAPGGVIIVELMSMDRPLILAPTRLAGAELGTQRYEWWLSGEPDGPDRMRLHTTWRVLRGERTVREVTDAYHWHTITLAQVAAESGLVLHDVPHATGGPPIGVLASGREETRS